MGRHATLSPSSASRWLICTPSALLESKMARTSSKAADEGTLAHDLSELLLVQYFRGIGHHQYINAPTNPKRLAEIQKNALYSDDMLKYVYQYRDFVIEAYNEALSKDPGAEIYFEVEVDLTTFIPGGFGTSDVIIISSERLHVIDLKFGTGVPVSSENNKQMMVYGRGSLERFEFIFEPSVVYMSIFQPRINNTSTWDIQTVDLIEWGDKILKPTAFIASTGAGNLKAGDHCHFCKIKNCKARAELNLELAKYDFREPERVDMSNDDTFLSFAEIADIVLKTKRFEKWLEVINTYAIDQAVNNNVSFPGLKVIQSSGKRMYKSAQEVELKLLASKFKPDLIFKPKELYGITEMEKRLGADSFQEYLGDLIIKSRGSLSLVSELHKSAAVDNLAQARLDFEVEADDEDNEFL